MQIKKATTIEGVVVTPLRQIIDERGKIMHMLRSDAPGFKGFGEIYFSCIHRGAIKAWHIHKEMTLNYACVSGKIKFVLVDLREGSPTEGNLMEIYIGPENHALVTVPPFVWNGFKGIGEGQSIVANCTDIPHSPDEIDRMDPFDPSIPYDWDIKHG
jgi:dTDP-4-dehydrorhamnose 3,5-epimerase